MKNVISQTEEICIKVNIMHIMYKKSREDSNVRT